MLISRTGTCSRIQDSKWENQKVKNSGVFNFKGVILNSLKSGFTLFELIVVVFILSLIVGLVIPSFYELGEGRLKSDAGKIASLLRYLNDSAMSRKETFTLKFNLDEKSAKWSTPEGERTEKISSLYSVTTTSDGNISSGELTLFFGPSGFRENLSILLKEENKELKVAFNPLSGRAKVISEKQLENGN